MNEKENDLKKENQETDDYNKISLNEEISERRKKRKKRLKRRSRLKFIKIIILFIIVIAAAAAISFFVFKSNNLKSISILNSCFSENFFDKKVYIDGENAICLFEPIFENDEVYIPLSFIDSAFVYNAVYDSKNSILSIASDFDRVKAYKDNDYYFLNGQKVDFGKKVFIVDNNNAYIAGDLIEKFYNVDIEFSDIYKTVCFDNTVGERKTAIISSEQELLNADKDELVIIDKDGNNITPKVFKGDYVSLYNESNGLSIIRTSDGLVGYVDSDIITERTLKEPIQKVRTADSIPISSKGKGVILFEQIANSSANNNFFGKEIPDSVDVLVPTWFSFKKVGESTDGTIISLADKKYVDYAHSKGRKVWGLITDNFSSAVSRAIVDSAVTREKVINQLEYIIKSCGLDGINIDFENIPADSMRNFTQFLRELSACLNNMNVSLSIDVYTPQPWSSYYNRKEFSEIVDYFIVMGYDEHTESDKKSGSVATKSWSENSITLTKDAGVPKEKLILAIPFYTRIWKETGNNIETRAYGMQEGFNAMTQKGASFKWLEDVGQNYAEINSDGATYKMWLEDEKSVEERMKIVQKHNIAGVAAWRRGLEKNIVWNTIKKYMKG